MKFMPIPDLRPETMSKTFISAITFDSIQSRLQPKPREVSNDFQLIFKSFLRNNRNHAHNCSRDASVISRQILPRQRQSISFNSLPSDMPKFIHKKSPAPLSVFLFPNSNHISASRSSFSHEFNSREFFSKMIIFFVPISRWMFRANDGKNENPKITR